MQYTKGYRAQYEKNGKVYYGAWSRVEAAKRGWGVL